MPAFLSTRSGLMHFAKWMLLAIGLTACIWTGVILWWRASQRGITPADVLVYLAILPVMALTAFVVACRLRARERHGDFPAMQTAALPSASEAEQPTLPSSDADGLPVISAWSITSAGTSLDEFRHALVEKRMRPQPDPGLLDDYGFPLHAARVPELDTSSAEQILQQIFRNNAAMAPLREEAEREGYLRFLALLSQLLNKVAAEWPLMEDDLADPAKSLTTATLRGNTSDAIHADTRLRLQIKLILSADFSPAEQQLALSYMLQSSALLPIAPERMHIEIIPARDEPVAMLLADCFRAQTLHVGQPQALLLLACDSALCPVVTERWQSEHRLFGSHTPQGLMPGEAAFAILCVNRSALNMAIEHPACLLHRVVQGQRDSSADTGGKASYAKLGELATNALAASALTGETIGAIACDADHRSSRVLECIGVMQEHAPHLDAIGDRLSPNEVCGHTGAATNAASWVAGIAHARDAGCPTLLLCVSHTFERAAAVLLPADIHSESTRIA